MSKVAELYYEPWNFKQFQEIKKEVVSSVSTWGDNRQEFLNTLGSTIKEIEFYEKPKRFYSPYKQMDLYFSWMSKVNDRRTRRIIAAHLLDYWMPISEKEYQKIKEKKETKIEKVNTLEFPHGLPDNHLLTMNAELDFDEPSEKYISWILEGSEEEKEYALKYGVISEENTYFMKNTTMIHDFYTKSRAEKYLNKDYREKIDAYHNTSMVYGIPSKRDFRRLGERVTEFCLLFAEMDYYKLEEYKHLSQKQMLEIIFKELDKHGFPRPTEVIYPRGLHLIWRTNPIPSYRAIEWEILQNKLYSILSKFGMDKQTVTDKVRLLRLVGTVHGKTGKKVFGYSYTSDRYLFDELLQMFCEKEVEKEEIRRKNARERYAKLKEKRLEVIEGSRTEKTSKTERKEEYTAHDISALIYERYLHDLFLLVHLRDGKMYGFREFLCFLVRWFSLVVNKGNKFKAFKEMEKMFYSLDIQGDYTLNQIEVFTRSAEKAYDKFLKNWRKGYNYKNTTLVDFFNISKEEQKRMRILIGSEEKKDREKVRDTNKKRNKRGSVSNEEVKEMIIKVTRENPDLKSYKIANLVREKLGKCSKNTVEKIWAGMTE